MKRRRFRSHLRLRRSSGNLALLPWTLLLLIPLLIGLGAVAMKIPADWPGWPGGIALVMGVAGLAAWLLLQGMMNPICRTTDLDLMISQPFSSVKIRYGNIIRVDRVRRVSRNVRGGVRIRFRQGGRLRIILFRPDYPENMVREILRHCPHLTGAKVRTLVRNHCFIAARRTLSVTDAAEEVPA